jgi:exosortase
MTVFFGKKAGRHSAAAAAPPSGRWRLPCASRGNARSRCGCDISESATTVSAFPLSAVLLAFSALLILRPLAHFWSANENDAYGWGVPFLAAYLLYERWRGRPDPALARPSAHSNFSCALILIAWAFAFLATRLVIETEPASRPLLWLNACLLVSALLAWFGLLGGRPWLRHFAFPVAFLLVGVPWIFRCEFFLTQGLMRFNAASVADTLALLDVPAHAAGNTIILATGQLGVTDACSGIRSLQAALMMGLFFGEFYRFGLRGRVALIGAGAALALLGNYARMLFLAWRGARDGVASVEAAHDSTGFFILGFTVVSLWLICLAAQPTRLLRGAIPREPGVPARRLALRWATGIFVATLFAEAATQGWYGWRENSAPRFPTWSVAWPLDAPSFQRTPLPAAIHDELHDDASSAAEWRDIAGWRWSGLWVRYHANATGKVVFESHNPELCLPAAGWRALPGGGSFAMELGAVHLVAQGRVFTIDGVGTAYVFWIPYLDRGTPAGADESRGIYGHSLAALARGKCPWLADVWHGCRGADAETLEVAVTGPPDYATAERAFRNLATALIRPDAIAPAR